MFQGHRDERLFFPFSYYLTIIILIIMSRIVVCYDVVPKHPEEKMTFIMAICDELSVPFIYVTVPFVPTALSFWPTFLTWWPRNPQRLTRHGSANRGKEVIHGLCDLQIVKLFD